MPIARLCTGATRRAIAMPRHAVLVHAVYHRRPSSCASAEDSGLAGFDGPTEPGDRRPRSWGAGDSVLLLPPVDVG